MPNLKKIINYKKILLSGSKEGKDLILEGNQDGNRYFYIDFVLSNKSPTYIYFC